MSSTSGSERPRAAARIDARRALRLRRRLLDWYARERRELPWRGTRDAYAIWISEAMLQQTRVETVLGYWQRFLERFPSVEQLARAREEDVLALWSGLGYYRRARNLWRAAAEIVARHGGRFPSSREDALRLSGVGRYTAGAVLSLAYGLAEPVVDGNVARVFCRLFALEGDPAAGPIARELWALAAELMPADGPAGEWNQALMELGATVCTPRAPACVSCPVRASCAARAAGRVEQFPQKPAPRVPIPVELEILLVSSHGRTLVRERPAGGRMAGLVEFPTRQLGALPRSGAPLFPAAWPALSSGAPALAAGALLGELRHAITHHRIRADVRAGSARFRRLPAGCAWRSRSELDALALTGMARKILRAGYA